MKDEGGLNAERRKRAIAASIASAIVSLIVILVVFWAARAFMTPGD